MDATVLILIVAIAVPVLVVWALSKSAALRGPSPPAAQRRRPVETLVTEAIPEEPPEEEPQQPGSRAR
jgi:hypothetical protein